MHIHHRACAHHDMATLSHAITHPPEADSHSLPPHGRLVCKCLQTLQQQPDQHSFASLFATGTDIFWHSVQLSAPMAGRVGKEAVMIPVRLKSAPAAKLSSLQHAGEVQGLALQQLEDGEQVAVHWLDDAAHAMLACTV